MARGVYKEITFEENYPRTFDQFRAEFENTHVFRGIEPKKRLKELKIAFEIATGKDSEKNPITREDIFTPDFVAEIESEKAKHLAKE